MANVKRKGFIGEGLACRLLESRGVKILKRNFKSPYGEVDIIGEDDGQLIFVEVKYWQTYSVAELEHSISRKKQERIIKTALFFLEQNPDYIDCSARYDVCFLARRPKDSRYFENAFEGDGAPL